MTQDNGFEGFEGDVEPAEDNDDREHNESVAAAFQTLKEAMEDDPHYAWGWHCNVAMSAADEGVHHSVANAAADRFMRIMVGMGMADYAPEGFQEEMEQNLLPESTGIPKMDEADLVGLLSGEVAPMYHRFPGTTVTVCALTCANGHVAVGHSACLDSAHFDEVEGVKAAYMDALRQLWALEGYARRDRNYRYMRTGRGEGC